MKHCIRYSHLTTNQGLATYWSHLNAMPASITSDREPGKGLS